MVCRVRMVCGVRMVCSDNGVVRMVGSEDGGE